jgi:thioredoxin-like negative regulator of GroEL
MIHLETDSLDVLVRTQPKLMVMFGTDWCGNCDILKPEFKRVSNQQQNRQIPFVFVNPDNFPDSREMVDLTNIPMIVAFRRGKVISSEYGNKKEIVSKVLSILLG